MAGRRGMRFLVLSLAVLLSSCAKEAVRPFEPKGNLVKEEKREVSGKVTFSGLSDKQLKQFEVVPESGGNRFVPKNGSYGQVDGFVWQKMTGKWFKIPGSCEVWVGEKPVERFDGVIADGGMNVWYRIGGAAKLLSVFIHGEVRPGWVDGH